MSCNLTQVIAFGKDIRPDVVWAYAHLPNTWIWMQEEWVFEECDDCVVHDIRAFMVPVPTTSHGGEAHSTGPTTSPPESFWRRFTRAHNLLNLKPAFHLSDLEGVEGQTSGHTRERAEQVATARQATSIEEVRVLMTNLLRDLNNGE
jgi:hypothetical protein